MATRICSGYLVFSTRSDRGCKASLNLTLKADQGYDHRGLTSTEITDSIGVDLKKKGTGINDDSFRP